MSENGTLCSLQSVSDREVLLLHTSFESPFAHGYHSEQVLFRVQGTILYY